MRTPICLLSILLVHYFLLSNQLFAQSSADALLQQGMDLARANRWNEAATALKNGEKLAPRDKRFPLELAGIAFKAKDLSAARAHLHRALSLDAQDSYGTEFLATVYFLEGNVEAALEYWNRLGRPRIEQIKTDAGLKIQPALLDRTFIFSPADVLKRKDFAASNLRLKQLGIFSRHQFSLAPREDGNFDLVFRGIERNGWGASTLDGLLSTFRGVFYQTLFAEFYNLRGAAINSLSLWRWDSDKQRFYSCFSGAPGGNPGWRYELNLDLRNENWAILDSPEEFGVESFRAGFYLKNIINGRTSWMTGAQVSKRNFKDLLKPDDPLFAEGVFLKYQAGLGYQLLRDTERRIAVESNVNLGIGRNLADSASLFSQLQMDLDATWFPNPRGEDSRMRARLRAGSTAGSVPIDEFYSIGVDRDHDLWIRAHSGLNEKKGHNPFGEHYVLINLEGDKVLYDHTFFRLTFTPFVDSGKVFAAPSTFGQKWLVDLGIQAKLRLIGGVTAVVTYGKNLRSGEGVLYLNVTR